MGTSRQDSLVAAAKLHIDRFLKAFPQGVIAIVGPTASGKTALAIELAQLYNGEIVSADSRVIYRELEIGTAKPTQEQRTLVPHYLIDIRDASEDFSVAEYQKLAYLTIDQIQERQHVPFLVGGTMLYIDAVLYNFLLPPVADLDDVVAYWRKQNLVTMQRKLLELRPDAAQFIDMANPVRLQRVLIHHQLHGTWLWEEKEKGTPRYPYLIIGLQVDKDALKTRIIDRVHKQFTDGLIDEVSKLEGRYGAGAPGLRTIGYTQVLEFFGDRETEAGAKEKVIRATLAYAKRQMTWWKRNTEIVWLDAS